MTHDRRVVLLLSSEETECESMGRRGPSAHTLQGPRGPPLKGPLKGLGGPGGKLCGTYGLRHRLSGHKNFYENFLGTFSAQPQPHHTLRVSGGAGSMPANGRQFYCLSHNAILGSYEL